MNCERCKTPITTQERTAYGQRCENCWAGTFKTINTEPRAIVSNHQFGLVNSDRHRKRQHDHD